MHALCTQIASDVLVPQNLVLCSCAAKNGKSHILDAGYVRKKKGRMIFFWLKIPWLCRHRLPLEECGRSLSSVQQPSESQPSRPSVRPTPNFLLGREKWQISASTPHCLWRRPVAGGMKWFMCPLMGWGLGVSLVNVCFYMRTNTLLLALQPDCCVRPQRFFDILWRQLDFCSFKKKVHILAIFEIKIKALIWNWVTGMSNLFYFPNLGSHGRLTVLFSSLCQTKHDWAHSPQVHKGASHASHTIPPWYVYSVSPVKPVYPETLTASQASV